LKSRFVRRLEKLTLWPKLFVLPQISHLVATWFSFLAVVPRHDVRRRVRRHSAFVIAVE
jgi:hypothetical protein